MLQTTLDWLTTLEWNRLFPELLGKMLGFMAGFGASWFLLFRKRLNALQRLKRGDSDDIIFQMHQLCPESDSDRVTLVFRNLAPKTTVNSLYDNPAAQDLVKSLAEGTTLENSVLGTQGTLGFEVLNDAAGHIAGLLAGTPFPRRTWLFAMTCEDRQIVRKKCIRCFLIRAEDLERFTDWDWCSTKIQVESPWHWFRIVALHRIAGQWRDQNLRQSRKGDTDMPLVNEQSGHDRIRKLSLGINEDEQPIEVPYQVRWESHAQELARMGLDLSIKKEPANGSANESMTN